MNVFSPFSTASFFLKRHKKALSNETKSKYLYGNKLLTTKPQEIFIHRDEQEEILNQNQFYQLMEVTYLSDLRFANEKILSSVYQECKNDSVKKASKWLGIYYSREITQNLHPKLSIRWINREKEYGLFAQEDIEPNMFILEYTGIVKPYHWRLDSHNPYCFEYPLRRRGKTRFTIDARDMGNESRFINHSTKPNLKPAVAYVEGVIHLILISRHPIAKGEELTYDYGPKYWEKREQPNEEIL